jgi:hypothetical protein
MKSIRSLTQPLVLATLVFQISVEKNALLQTECS